MIGDMIYYIFSQGLWFDTENKDEMVFIFL